MGKKQTRTGPITQEEIYRIYKEAKENPLSRPDVPSTIMEVNTASKGVSKEAVLKSNQDNKGNASYQSFLDGLKEKSSYQIMREKEAIKAIEKERSYMPNDFVEGTAKELLPKEDYQELKDLKKNRDTIMSEDPSYRAGIKAKKKMNESRSFLDGGLTGTPKFIEDIGLSIADAFLPETFGMENEENKKVIEDLDNRIHAKQLPVLQDIKTKLETALRDVRWEGIKYEDAEGKDKKFSHKRGELRMAENDILEQIESLDAVMNKSSGWQAIGDNLDRELGTVGMYGMVKNVMFKLPAYLKMERGEQLDPTTEMMIKADGLVNQIQASGTMEHGRGYRILDGTMKTLPFLGQMAASSGTAGLVTNAAKKLAKKAVKKGAQAGVGAATRAALNLEGKALTGAAAVATQTGAMPMTYSSMVDRYRGMMEVDFDDQGSVSNVYMRGDLYKKTKDEYSVLETADRNRRQELLDSGTTEGKELDEIEARLGMKDVDGIMSYSEMLEKVKPISTGKAIRQGFFDTANELITEKYAGKFIDGVAAKLPYIKQASNAFVNTKAGRIYKNIQEGTEKFADPIGLNSMPAEYLEEIFVAPLNSLNSGNLEEIEALGNADTHIDILGQTAIMGLGFRAVGGAMTLPSRIANKEFYDNRKEVRKRLAAIRRSITDEGINTLINFSSAQSGFTISDQRIQVQKLRNEGKEQEADKMEQKMFYNLAMKSMKTNTSDEFMATLDRVANNTNLSEKTRANAVLAKQDIAKVKKVYDRYSHLPNRSDVAQMESNKVIGKRTLTEIEAKKNEIQDDVREDLDAILRANNMDLTYTLEDLYDKNDFADKADRKNYELFLSKVQEAELASLQSYDYLRTVAEDVRATVDSSMRTLNEIVSPKFQERQKGLQTVEKEVVKALKKKGNVVLTEAHVDEAFRDVTEFKSIGRTLSKQDIADLKQEFKTALDKGKEQERLAKEVKIRENTKPVDNRELEEVPQSLVSPVDQVDEEGPIVEDTALQVEISEAVQEMKEAFVLQDDGLDNFDELPRNIDDFTEEQTQAVTNATRRVYEALQRENGKEPTFKDLIHGLMAFTPKQMVEENFDAYAAGWKGNNYKETDFQEVYQEVFDDLKNVVEESMQAISKIFESIGTKDNAKQKETIIEEAEPIIGFDANNMPIKAVKGQRSAIVETKLGFSAIKYVEVIDEEGNYRKVQANDMSLNLDEDSIIDFSDLLHPDKYNQGDTFGVAVAPESMWAKVPMSVSRNAKGEKIVTMFSDWLAQKELSNPNFRNTKEFKDMVPMFALNEQGTPMAYIHDTSWFTPFTVADPTSEDGIVDLNNISVAHNELIEEGKKNASVLREAIIDQGISTLEIKVKKEGIFYQIDENLPEIRVADANPQNVLAVQMGTKIMVDYDTPFENENRMLVNSKSDLRKIEGGKYSQNGNVWDIRRIGTDPETGKETWRAFGVTRKTEKGQFGIHEDQLETLRWMWSAQAKFSEKAGKTYRNNVKGGPYELTDEEATNIIEKVKEISGVDIRIPNEANRFFNTYGVTPNKNVNTLEDYGKSIYRMDNTQMRQYTSLVYLADTKMIMPRIVDKKVESSGLTHADNIRATTTTNVKSFNVGTEAEPMYATSIQPTLIIGIANEQVPVKEFKQRIEEEVIVEEVQETENLEETLDGYENLLEDLGFGIEDDVDDLPAQIVDMQSLDNIFNITPGLTILQEGQITDYLFNNLLISIDIKYGAKINKKILLNEIKGSYESITKASRQQMEKTLPELEKLHESNPNQQGRLAKLIRSYKKGLETLDNIEANWTDIESKALAKVEKYTDIKETRDEEVVQEEDMSIREKDYSKSSIEENGKQKTSYRLRRFMAGIKAHKPNGEVRKGFLNLPTYIGFNDVYNSVAQYFGTGVDIQSDYGIMLAKLKEMKDSEPWVSELIDKLENADEQLKKEFVYNYTKHALQMKFAMYSTGNQGTTLKIYDTNANEITRLINDSWRNNFLMSNLVTNTKDTASVNKQFAKSLLKQYQDWGNEKHLVPDSELLTWLGHFGVDITEQTWQEIKDGKFYSNGKYLDYGEQFYTGYGMFNLFSQYLERVSDDKLINTEFEENEKNHPFTDMQGVLKTLAKTEAKYTPQSMTLTFRDGGKQVSGQVPTKFVTDRVNELKRSAMGDKEFLRQMSDLSISQNSILLDLLMNEAGYGEKFSISHNGITAIKELGKSASNFASVTDLNSTDHDVAKLTGFQDTRQGTVKRRYMGVGMRMANMFLPTMSDKSQMLMLKTGVFNFMSESQALFSEGEFGSPVINDTVKKLLVDQLAMPELKRIMNFHKNVKATDITGYDLGAQMFHMIPELNNVTDRDGIKLIEYLAVSDTITMEYIEENFMDSMKQVLNKTVGDLVKEKMRIWENEFLEKNPDGSIKSIKLFDKSYLNSGSGTLAEKFEIGAYDFVMNSLISNANAFTMFAGDPALYSQDKVFSGLAIDNAKMKAIALTYGKEALFKNQKDYKSFIGTLDNMLAEGVISNNLYEDMKVNIRPLVHTAENDFYAKASKTIGTNIGKRLALMIAPGNKLANSLNEEYIQLFAKDSIDISENSDYLIKLFYGEEGKKKAAPLLGAYKEALSTGDQNSMKVLRGQLADTFPSLEDYFDMESTDAQEYTTVWEHINILENQGRITSQQMNQIKDALLANKDLKKEELDLVMQPIKPVYTGQVYDPEQDVMRTVYIKSSSFPLLPQVTAGTKLDAVREKMESLEAKEGKPVRMSYQTANKVGSMSNAKDIFSEELDDIGETALVLSRDNFRIQQDVPFKSDTKKDDKVSMGTQMFKLLFGDGMMDAKGFEYNGQEYTGRSLYNEYNNIFQTMVEVEKGKLFRELGLDDNAVPINEEETIKKLQKLLQKEAESKGYPIQDIKGLELEEKKALDGTSYYEFKVPLWLSVNSNRYESLLNSIVTNRIMSFKIPGNSYVAGSETGFARLKSLDNLSRSRIIRLDGWNGEELQGAKKVKGKMQSAQVLLPSKLKDTDGKLIDLYQKKGNEYVYLVEREDGSLNLREEMIDPQLLQGFSFRTPTSAHVSGSNIQVVGILPPEVGDLMIVPKNFTKQKGLDYDIDKETSYQFNHILNEDGTITILSEEHREKRLKGLIRALKKEEAIFGSTEDKFLFALLGDKYDEFINDELTTIEDKIRIVNEEYDTKLLQNEFIKVHMSVFNNPDNEVQKKTNKVLSMKFASDQADMIEELSSNEDQTSFTMLSDEYQKAKMGLGAAGKLAIGVYSNYVTFHGLVQQSSSPISLQMKTEDGYTNKPIRVGNLVSEGDLGRVTTLDGSRPIAEAFAERQNTATDNEKEQILGRVNVNSVTIDVDSFLTALGFDKDANGNSISYTLLSQPVLKEYVARMQAGKGVVSEYKSNLEDSIIDDLVRRYSEDSLLYSEGMLYDKTDYTEVDLSDVLTGDNLLDGISNDTEMVQLAALVKFLELDKYAKGLKKVQSVLNTDNLGKSITEASINYKELSLLPDNVTFSNIFSLIGDAVPVSEDRPEGYQRVGDYFMKAGTPQGKLVMEGLILGNKLWNEYFPYTDKYFEDVIKETLGITATNTESSFREIEARQDIIKEVKKYIYSKKSNGIFMEQANEERARLFMNKDGNVPLAEYLTQLTRSGLEDNSAGVTKVRSNRLLNKFSYEVGTTGEPSIIKFNNTSNDNFDEEYLYNSFAELIIEDSPLPSINGKDYSTRELAQDLISYAYLEGGIQEAIQFIKYVPVEYLDAIGIMKDGKKVTAANMLQTYNSKRRPDMFQKLLGHRIVTDTRTHIFTKQYIQHYPEKAVQFSKEERNKIINATEGKGNDIEKFELNQEERPKFISIKVPTKLKKKQDKFRLYEHQGNGEYTRIDILGIHGMSEYQYNDTNAKSLMDNVRVVPKKKRDVKKSNSSTDDLLSNMEGKNLREVTEMFMGEQLGSEHINRVLDFMKPLLKDDTEFNLTDTGQRFAGRYDRKKNLLSLNKRALVGKSKDQVAKTFAHELIHSVTSSEIRKYYNDAGTELRTDISIPNYVTALHRAFYKFRQSLPASEIKAFQDKKAAIKDGLPNIDNFTDRELDLVYGATSIMEFLTVGLTTSEFQKHTEQIPFSKDMSIWDKFKRTVIDILLALRPSVEADTLLVESFSTIMNFISEEAKVRQQSATFETFQKTSTGFQESDPDVGFEEGDPDTMGNQEGSEIDLLPVNEIQQLPDCL